MWRHHAAQYIKQSQAFETWQAHVVYSTAHRLQAKQAQIEMSQYQLETAFIRWLCWKDRAQWDQVVDHCRSGSCPDPSRRSPEAPSLNLAIAGSAGPTDEELATAGGELKLKQSAARLPGDSDLIMVTESDDDERTVSILKRARLLNQ